MRFTLTLNMMKAFLRLAACLDPKQAGVWNGDSIQFIAFDLALIKRTPKATLSNY